MVGIHDLLDGSEYSEEEVVFLKAIDAYKRQNRRLFPTWQEVLQVFYSLGYRKTEDAVALPKFVKVIARAEPFDFKLSSKGSR